jgi:hypothetical protein
MADERPEDIEASTDFGRPKRPGPTIDLEATEVIGEAGSLRREAATEAGAEAAAQAGGEAAAAGETAAPEAAAGATSGEAPPARPRVRWIASALVSAITGASAAALVVAGLWFWGWPGDAAAPAPVAPQIDNTAVDALATRIARIESKAFTEPTAAPDSKSSESKASPDATAAPPSGSTPDPAAATRIDELEKSIASLREELGASRARSERLGAAVDALKAAPRDAAAPPDLSAINADLSAVNERLGQIERAAQAQIADAARQSAKPADDKPLRRLVAATLLDVSVRHGEPYAAALDAAKALAPDPSALKPLEPFAATGVPNPGAISRDLLTLLPKPAPAPETPTTTGAGIVDRLQAGAARLVRIQRTDAGDGSDRSGVVVRAAAAAQRNDMIGARRELNSLPDPDRTAVQPGIERLDARDAALAASRQFAADAMAALTKPAP